MARGYYDEPDYFGIGLFAVVILFIVLLFGGMIRYDSMKDERAEQCIAAGKDWIDGNCLTRK